MMSFKFENLEVWGLSLEYLDGLYALAERLPRSEDFNLKSQLLRAGTSVALNIAEGSTGQTNAELARFLGYAVRSLVETVACMHIIRRRQFPVPKADLDQLYEASNSLAAKLQSLRKKVAPNQPWVSEACSEPYEV
jgi:four helix bundle protein